MAELLAIGLWFIRRIRPSLCGVVGLSPRRGLETCFMSGFRLSWRCSFALVAIPWLSCSGYRNFVP